MQAVKQFWSVSDIQDMDFTRFATIQNFINVHIIVKKKCVQFENVVDHTLNMV